MVKQAQGGQKEYSSATVVVLGVINAMFKPSKRSNNVE